MNSIQTAITVLTLAIFITFAPTSQTQTVNTNSNEIAQNQIDGNLDGVTLSNNSIQGNTGGDGCAGCTPIGPGN